MTSLAELFPASGHRFHLTLQRGAPRDFFRPLDASGRILAERARWLADSPARYAVLLPEGEPLLVEFVDVCAEWGLPIEKNIGAVAAALEPDILLLSPGADGIFRLRGGALCFPTGWTLEDKIGQTMDFIHSPVPGLNGALGSPISRFLERITPGIAFQRDNWGLAATDALNLHLSRPIPPIVAPVALDRLWLRIEHQALVALPRSGGVVFGIRIELHRLDTIARLPAVAAGLRLALETMPAALAEYKRLQGVRKQICELLK